MFGAFSSASLWRPGHFASTNAAETHVILGRLGVEGPGEEESRGRFREGVRDRRSIFRRLTGFICMHFACEF